MFLYHYYDANIGPFMNLSDLPRDKANEILEKIRKEKPNVQSTQRDADYMYRRFMYEDIT